MLVGHVFLAQTARLDRHRRVGKSASGDAGSLYCVGVAVIGIGRVAVGVEGVGVALGQHALVAPLAQSAPIRMPYYLVYPTAAVENPGGANLGQLVVGRSIP